MSAETLATYTPRPGAPPATLIWKDGKLWSRETIGGVKVTSNLTPPRQRYTPEYAREQVRFLYGHPRFELRWTKP